MVLDEIELEIFVKQQRLEPAKKVKDLTEAELESLRSEVS